MSVLNDNVLKVTISVTGSFSVSVFPLSQRSVSVLLWVRSLISYPVTLSFLFFRGSEVWKEEAHCGSGLGKYRKLAKQSTHPVLCLQCWHWNSTQMLSKHLDFFFFYRGKRTSAANKDSQLLSFRSPLGQTFKNWTHSLSFSHKTVESNHNLTV